MNILDKMFTLPPVEQRRMVGGAIKHYLYPHWTKERDDTYIYYLMMKYGFIICVFFAVIYLASYFFQIRFDFRLFEIYVGRETPVNGFIFSYPFVTTTILLLLILPYGAIMARKYIDPDEVDLLSWNVLGSELRRTDRKKFLRNFKLSVIIFPIAMYGGFALPYMITQYIPGLHDSIAYLIFWCVFYSSIYPGGVSLGFAAYLAFKQNKNQRGPYYTKTYSDVRKALV